MWSKSLSSLVISLAVWSALAWPVSGAALAQTATRAPTHTSTATPTRIVTKIPTAEDLVKEANAFRASAGMRPLNIDPRLMEAAQSHSQYLTVLGYMEHKGPGGSDPDSRAVDAGYGEGSAVVCKEALAFASRGADIKNFFTNPNVWGTRDYRDNLFLNPDFTDMGGGAAEKEGALYYTLVFCRGGAPLGAGETPAAVTSGTQAATKPAKSPTYTRPSRTPTITKTPDKEPLYTVTPAMDGAIVHVIQRGQTLWDLEMAYGVSVLDLAASNGIDPAKPIIYIGQKIIVRRAFTPTASPTVTQTPKPPTRTPIPTRTPRPPTEVPTITTSPTSTTAPLVELPRLEVSSRNLIGIIVVVISGLGLVIAIGLGGKGKPKPN